MKRWHEPFLVPQQCEDRKSEYLSFCGYVAKNHEMKLGVEEDHIFSLRVSILASSELVIEHDSFGYSRVSCDTLRVVRPARVFVLTYMQRVI